MFRTPSRGAAAGIALGSVGFAVGIAGSPPVLLPLDATAAHADSLSDSFTALAPAGPRPDTAWAGAAGSNAAVPPFASVRPLRHRAQATATTPPRARRAVSRRPGAHRLPGAQARPGAHRAERAHLTERAHRAERAHRSAPRRELARDPRGIAREMVRERGWSETQWRCLDLLWNRESNWRVHATNPSSGAYGIPQSLPAEKLARFGADWRDNPVTQIRWGLWYIDGRYGTPCAAWEHSERYNYY